MLFSAFGIKNYPFWPGQALLPLVINKLVMYRLKTGFIKAFSVKMQLRCRKKSRILAVFRFIHFAAGVARGKTGYSKQTENSDYESENSP